MLPDEALPLLAAFAPHFTRPTFERFSLLMVAAILTRGRHNVANLLRTLGQLAPGHRTDYQRVLSRAPWSGLRLGCALAGFILMHLIPDGPVILVGDDTVDGHPGRQGPRQGAAPRPGPLLPRLHRLAVRPSLGRAGRPGPVPLRHPPLGPAGARRPVPLRGGQPATRAAAPHAGPADVPAAAAAPDPLSRTAASCSSATAATARHEVARFVHRHRDRLTLVSKLHPEANLFDPPPPYRGKGRPRVKGAGGPSHARPSRRPPPRRVDRRLVRRRHPAGGGRQRHGALVQGRATGLVPIRWVFVHDRDGTHRDEYFYTTDPALAAAEIIARYAAPLEHRDHVPGVPVATSARRRPGAGRRADGAAGDARACSGCTRWSPCCTTPCRSRSVAGASAGPARAA